MKQLAAAVPQSEMYIVIMNGKEKGANFKIVGGRITIGRGPENNIVLTDDAKISREHAVVTFSDGRQEPEIVNLSEQKALYVNGQEVKSHKLIPDCIIQMGDTKMQFKVKEAAPQRSPDLAIVGHRGPASTPSQRRSRGRPNQQSPMMFYVILGVVVIGGLYMATYKSDKKQPPGLKTDEQISAEIDASKKLVEKAAADRKQNGLNSRQYAEAQPNFVKGFRDYKKGQYERAIESFRACLSLFPQHAQCERYLQLANKKYAELYQYHILLARKYKDQAQYEACMAGYRNAMVMIKDPSNRSYQEAKAGYDLCESLKGEKF